MTNGTLAGDPLTVAAAARLLGLTGQRVRALINGGQLAAVRTPLGYLLDSADVEAFKHHRNAFGRYETLPALPPLPPDTTVPCWDLPAPGPIVAPARAVKVALPAGLPSAIGFLGWARNGVHGRGRNDLVVEALRHAGVCP